MGILGGTGILPVSCLFSRGQDSHSTPIQREDISNATSLRTMSSQIFHNCCSIKRVQSVTIAILCVFISCFNGGIGAVNPPQAYESSRTRYSVLGLVTHSNPGRFCYRNNHSDKSSVIKALAVDCHTYNIID